MEELYLFYATSGVDMGMFAQQTPAITAKHVCSSPDLRQIQKPPLNNSRVAIFYQAFGLRLGAYNGDLETLHNVECLCLQLLVSGSGVLGVYDDLGLGECCLYQHSI